MSMLTFLLDGSEGLNQIRCMELALVHDLAESLVGDITPFCGVSKDEKRAMEFKAMEDICKLIEPRGKRIMELFEVSNSARFLSCETLTYEVPISGVRAWRDGRKQVRQGSGSPGHGYAGL